MPNIDGAITWPDFLSGYWFPLLEHNLVYGIILFVVALGFVSLVWDWLVGGLRTFIDDVAEWTNRGLIGRQYHTRARIDPNLMPGYTRYLDPETGATVVNLGWQNRTYNHTRASVVEDLIGPPPPLEDDDPFPVTNYLWDANEDD